MIGENPSMSDAPTTYGVQMLYDSVNLMQSCGLQGLLWALDGNLYDGMSGITISDYANIIAQYPH